MIRHDLKKKGTDGTRNSKPVTIAVKAVPSVAPNWRELTSPTAKAAYSIADTTSDLLKIGWFAVSFAANEIHQMMTDDEAPGTSWLEVTQRTEN
jgi:hypothetical protein